MVAVLLYSVCLAHAGGSAAPTPGDANCDEVINNFDIEPFTLALLDPPTWLTLYPDCGLAHWDPNADGLLNDFDIDPFVHVLLGPVGNTPPWPVSTERLDCVSVLQAYTNVVHWQPMRVIHSIQLPQPVTNPQAAWNLIKQNVRTAQPEMLYGTYISGSAFRRTADMFSYPFEALPYETAPLNMLLGPYDVPTRRAAIDLDNPAARLFMADRIVAEVIARDVPLVFLDNMAHPDTGGTRASWVEVTEYMRDMRIRLNRRGTKVMANIACQPYWLAGTDALLTETALDGVNFEQPFHWTLVRPFADRVVGELEVYRQFLNAGMHVSLMAGWSAVVSDPSRYVHEERVLAALCMMIHRPGQSLFVPRSAYYAAPDWATWPTTFGPALGPYTVVSSIGPVLRREFTHATLTVNLALSTNVLTAPIAVTVTPR